MTDDIIWEEPPAEVLERARLGPKGPYLDWALEVKTRPGKWARSPRQFASADSARNTATNMRRGQVKGFTKGEWEIVTHETSLWVRYLGPQEASKKAAATEDDDDDAPRNSVRSDYARKVRQWARENAIQVADHGRIPGEVIHHYIAATGDEPPQRGLEAVQ